MLVELGLVEQRYRAVLEVLNDGASVVDVARRYGVARQTVHVWLRAYATLEREGVTPLPGRTSVDRCLVRHGLLSPQPRRRKRADYRRWERSRAMELWQMDIVGGVQLADGTDAKVVSGIDDHSRFVVSARVVARATAVPVCDALELALARHGAPGAILTDNGKVFTARFGPGPGPVRFDRICAEQGIKHLLTAPRSPTTTGKVERWHKTLRGEFLTGSSTGGSRSTTTTARTSRSAACPHSNASGSPSPRPARSSRPRHQWSHQPGR